MRTQLAQRLLTPDRLDGYPRFEARTVLFSRPRHQPLLRLATAFLNLLPGPNFWDHYKPLLAQQALPETARLFDLTEDRFRQPSA